MILLGALLLPAPQLIWRITEKWKFRNADKPSRAYMIVVRCVGVVVIAVGCLLCFGILE